MEYDGLEVALVKFDNGVLGKVSVNAECIMPYRFPLRIFGDLGSVFDNRIWSHKYPGPDANGSSCRLCCPIPATCRIILFRPKSTISSSACNSGRQSHCSLDDAIKTHEIALAAAQSARDNRPVRLPLLDEHDR